METPSCAASSGVITYQTCLAVNITWDPRGHFQLLVSLLESIRKPPWPHEVEDNQATYLSSREPSRAERHDFHRPNGAGTLGSLTSLQHRPEFPHVLPPLATLPAQKSATQDSRGKVRLSQSNTSCTSLRRWASGNLSHNVSVDFQVCFASPTQPQAVKASNRALSLLASMEPKS